MTKGCSECWFLYYLYCIAATEPSRRQEEIDHLEAVIHHQVEVAAKGDYDFQPYARPKVEITQEPD